MLIVHVVDYVLTCGALPQQDSPEVNNYIIIIL